MKPGKKEEIEKRKKRIKSNLSKIKHQLLVISGKGGVGKTTVAVNLAYGLAEKGFQVGILDIDFHGPNVAKMLGIEKRDLKNFGQGIEPVRISEGLKAMSLALMIEDSDQPVVWRGPLKMIAIQQLLGDVNWGELDFLVIDSPPGTGDEPLSVCQVIPAVDGSVIVTTPQDVAVTDARKAVNFSRQLEVPVVGVIENMSGFTCPHCGEEINLFQPGGGEKAADELNVPFLGRLPLSLGVSRSSDSGSPFLSSQEDTPAAQAMQDVLDRVIDFYQE